MRPTILAATAVLLCGAPQAPALAQPPAKAQAAPGDAMIRAYLDTLATRLERDFPNDVATARDWQEARPGYREQYLDMLGLQPLPERTPLKATVTGQVEGDGFVVEKLHYQSMPGLYVTANLYRPTTPAGRLPAVLYVCGHSGMGRDGVKTAFQTHGIWFAKHGYVCLVVDTLQLGEIAAIHHGTYREGRWWWHSRGYTSAGVECWNGVRGLDYLVSRPDVDPDRLAVTGISGGGAATFWVAAADDRVKVAVPVSGMADLHSYVNNQVVNGHCDCMFLHNTYQWPWTRIAGLVAPRPLLFVNSDADSIFPMDANERVIARLERLYAKFAAGDRVDAVVSVGGHAYRGDILQAAYRFINTHLKGDPRIVEDAEATFVSESRRAARYPIEPTSLRVFTTDADIPKDERNTTIDRSFVPIATPEPLPAGPDGMGRRKATEERQARLLARLRARSFRSFPERIPAARPSATASGNTRMATEEGIEVVVTEVAKGTGADILLEVSLEDEPGGDGTSVNHGGSRLRIQPRGVGPTSWTRRNPPNTIERSLALLGRTADDGRVWDVAAVARASREGRGTSSSLTVSGRGKAGVIAALAALLEPGIDRVVVVDPPDSFMDSDAPAFLNVLRVLDIPEVLGLLAGRRLEIQGGSAALRNRVVAVFAAAGSSDRLRVSEPR